MKQLTQLNQAQLPPPEPAMPAEPTVKDAAGKPFCRFTMFVRVADDNPFRFKHTKPGEDDKCFTYRGDMYGARTAERQLKTLIGIVKSRHRQYKLMEIKDQTKPPEDGQMLVLKILHSEVKRNVLPEYAELLKRYPLPEILSYEIKD